MTDQQIEFLRLYIILQLDYKTVSEKLNIPRSLLAKWYEELKFEREKIARIRTIWNRKKFTPVFEDFYIWYLACERKCEYCDITEDEIQTLLECGRLTTKRIGTRGKKLEYDRKIPELSYDQIENVVLCCYWCNNAKTDTFTYEEFKEIGKVFNTIWRKRLSQ